MAIISCGTKLYLGMNFKLSSSFTPSSGKQIRVNSSLLEPVSSAVISLCPPLPSHLRHIRFSVQGVLSLANWEDKNEMKCPYSPCALPSSFSFSSLFLETQQNLILPLLSVPGSNLSLLCIKGDASYKLPRARVHSLSHLLFLLPTLVLPLSVQPSQETPDHNSAFLAHPCPPRRQP